MDHFLKRVPAFSRVFGCSDSEEEEYNSSDEIENCSDIFSNEANFRSLLNNRFFSKLIISVGPFATAFFDVGLQLFDDTKLFSVSVDSKKFATINYSLTDTDNTLIVSMQQDKTFLSSKQKHIIRMLLDLILDEKHLEVLKSTHIVSSASAHQFLSQSFKPPLPFIRTLSTCEADGRNSSLTLEHPNIINGLAAEILTWFYLHSIPTTLYVCYYSSQTSEICSWSAVKEVFSCLNSILSLRILPKSFCTTWDNLSDELKKICTIMICGNKPTKMDQMFT